MLFLPFSYSLFTRERLVRPKNPREDPCRVFKAATYSLNLFTKKRFSDNLITQDRPNEESTG